MILRAAGSNKEWGSHTKNSSGKVFMSERNHGTVLKKKLWGPRNWVLSQADQGV